MTFKRIWILGLVAAVLLAGASIGLGAASRPAQGAEGETVPYAGRLTDAAGAAVTDGAYDLRFDLYAVETGGEALWSETQSGVEVTGGAFGVVLGSANPVPKETLTGGAWLEVSVRGPGEAAFTALAPRQQFSAATAGESPDLAGICAHTHYNEIWSGTSTSYGLSVENLGSGDGIRGLSHATSANYAGLYGYNYSTGPGVYGQSASGGPGVAGYSTTGRGVYGSGADGVVGESSTNGMSGMYAHSTAATGGYGITAHSPNYFGMQAWGNDASLTDLKGDIVLQGSYGEIFSFGPYLDLYSNADVFVDLDNDNNEPYASFTIVSGSNIPIWSVSETSGVINGGKQASIVDTADGQRLMYAVEGTGVWLEDLGTAALGPGGELTVAFDPLYAGAADLGQPYQVFVTPLSDQPVLLYVTSKTAGGFTVRGVTLDGQPASCSFDYRIVAPRLGYDGLRMEQYTQLEKGQQP